MSVQIVIMDLICMYSMCCLVLKKFAMLYLDYIDLLQLQILTFNLLDFEHSQGAEECIMHIIPLM